MFNIKILNQHNKIFLLGFMGSGKTTLANKLANKLNISFFDLDKEIEKEAQLSVVELFEKHGEDYFREAEKTTLKKTIKNNDSFVMAVGGGTPCYSDNMKLMNTSGTTIYLKYDAEILALRLISVKSERPLIKDLNEAELIVFVKNKLSERERYYNQSKFVLEGNNLNVDDLINLVQ